MKLVNYYGYIKHTFYKKCLDAEQAADLTQDFFVYYIKNKHKLIDKISLNFIRIAVDYFYKWFLQINRRQKRSGVVIPSEEILMRQACVIPYEETIYTKQLATIVDRLVNNKLKQAIYFLIEQCGEIGKANEKIREIIKYNREMLCSLST